MPRADGAPILDAKMKRWIPVVVAIATLLAAACELPQDSKGQPSPGSDVGDVSVGNWTWLLLRIVDKEALDATDALPGADIDAIVLFHDGAFLFAGCADASLFGEDPAHQDNVNVDPDRATLAVREDSEGSGFVSLGGGTLLCELPVEVHSGDLISIWEIESDGAEQYSVSFAENAGDGASESAGTFTGSAEITVP